VGVDTERVVEPRAVAERPVDEIALLRRSRRRDVDPHRLEELHLPEIARLLRVFADEAMDVVDRSREHLLAVICERPSLGTSVAAVPVFDVREQIGHL
jgi:hypothetical protein